MKAAMRAAEWIVDNYGMNVPCYPERTQARINTIAERIAHEMQPLMEAANALLKIANSKWLTPYEKQIVDTLRTALEDWK